MGSPIHTCRPVLPLARVIQRAGSVPTAGSRARSAPDQPVWNAAVLCSGRTRDDPMGEIAATWR
jgi:hypothetical protein